MSQSMVELTNPSSVKTPVVIRPDYVMYLEFWNGDLWFHTDIHKWTSRTKRHYKIDLQKLEDVIQFPLIALIQENNIKLRKFAEIFNWKEIKQIMLQDGSQAFIYASQRYSEHCSTKEV